MLAEIASRADDDNFMHNWLAIENEQEIRDTLLREERFMSLLLRPGTSSSQFIGKTLKELDMPGESLVAIIRRKRQTIVPRGNTVLQKGDYLIIIGGQKEIRQFQNSYGTKM